MEHLFTEVGTRQWLVLADEDPFDYARVERKIPATSELKVAFDLQAAQNDQGLLQIEFLDEAGTACSRIELTAEGIMQAKGGARYGGLGKYEAGKVCVEEIFFCFNK